VYSECITFLNKLVDFANKQSHRESKEICTAFIAKHGKLDYSAVRMNYSKIKLGLLIDYKFKHKKSRDDVDSAITLTKFKLIAIQSFLY
jgi:hypothetical protein